MTSKLGPFELLSNRGFTERRGLQTESSTSRQPVLTQACPAELPLEFTDGLALEHIDPLGRTTPRLAIIQDTSIKAPERNFDCDNYDLCLGLAAALDWSSFSCQGCCGRVNKQLLWRANHKAKEDKSLSGLFNLPSISPRKPRNNPNGSPSDPPAAPVPHLIILRS